ncbi:MAG TPA: Scr1 family TA system antitoxin-like transcriptional regulator [Trebonia sp.]
MGSGRQAAGLLSEQALARTDGTASRLTAVITEASLAYHWGTTAQQREQVEHLITASGKPNVELRLLRFEDGPHPGMSSLINLFDFPGDEDPSIVYLEIDTALQEITNAGEVRAYTEIFARIRQSALDPAATRHYLERVVTAIT